MLKLLRVDNRLIHGQVAFSLVSAYQIKKIVVANDEYANNPMLKMTLNLGKPPGVALDVLTVEKAIAYLNDPTKKLDAVMVVSGNVEDAAQLVLNSSVVGEVCIGGVPEGEGRKLVHTAIFLSPEHLELMKQMQEHGAVVYAQDIPSNKKVSTEEIIEKY